MSQLKLILEQKQVIRGRDRYDVFERMPRGMQYFLVKVQTVHANLVFFSFALRTNFARSQYGFRFRDIPGRFQGDVAFRRPIKHAEKVIVWASHDGGVVSVPAAFKFVKNAIVLV